MTNIKYYGAITLGTFLTSFAIGSCYLPNKIVNGGVSGISTMLFHIIKMPPGITYALINITLLAISYIVIGRQFVFNSILGSMLLTVFVQFTSYFGPLTTDPLLSAVFGGLLYGIGIGITLVFGANTGGTDILGRLLQCKLPHVSIGNLLLCVDGIVIIISLFVFKAVELAMYGILALIISAFVIDLIIKKLNISKLAFVITDKGEEISGLLVNTSPRGVTKVQVIGAYSNDNKCMLMCALKSKEANDFQKKILSIDNTAFIIFSESQQILGNGFSIYK